MLFLVSTSLRTTKKWWHLSHLTNRVELTKVSTWVHGSPHLGHVRTPPEPDFLPPDDDPERQGITHKKERLSIWRELLGFSPKRGYMYCQDLSYVAILRTDSQLDTRTFWSLVLYLSFFFTEPLSFSLQVPSVHITWAGGVLSSVRVRRLVGGALAHDSACAQRPRAGAPQRAALLYPCWRIVLLKRG